MHEKTKWLNKLLTKNLCRFIVSSYTERTRKIFTEPSGDFISRRPLLFEHGSRDYAPLSRDTFISTFSSHTEYVKRESIVIAWVEKEFSPFDECSCFICLSRQNKQKKFPSVCLSVCPPVCLSGFTFKSPFLVEKCMKWFQIFRTRVKNTT